VGAQQATTASRVNCVRHAKGFSSTLLGICDAVVLGLSYGFSLQLSAAGLMDRRWEHSR
jgi:hypothetical protein